MWSAHPELYHLARQGVDGEEGVAGKVAVNTVPAHSVQQPVVVQPVRVLRRHLQQPES